MIEGMKIVRANQFHLLVNYDTTHENSESKSTSSLSKSMIVCMKIVKAIQYHFLPNHNRTHVKSEIKPISSLSKQ